MNKTASSLPASPGKFLLNCLIAASIGIAVIFVLSGICALVLNTSENPENMYGICAIAIYAISSLVSGFLAKRKNGISALFCGLLSGILLIALLFVISLAIPQAQPKTPLWQLIILPAGAILGAIFSK